jgi:hypothetical protein
VKRVLVVASLLFLPVSSAAAQEITVSPSSVTAYSQGATTAFLTFGNTKDKSPVEGCFCGDLIPAAPAIGFKCNPATVFGCLPVRYDQSRRSANNSYTDIMSIPPSVARRAYLDAASGADATFFYVRHFVSQLGGPDEFVPVVIRLGGNGSSAPFSITNVNLAWGVDKPVILVKPEERLPQIQAEISYTGTGRLSGRWEIVKPGEELPEGRDLLTESTLPIEERGKQRRYTTLSRFNVFLAPVGRFVLPGPELWRVPSHLEGLYLILLRIETTDDASANATGAATGGVAGFAMPVLRYYVGASTGQTGSPTGPRTSAVSPADNAILAAGATPEFTWNESEAAAFYRIEICDLQNKLVLNAVLLPADRSYRAPPWLLEKLSDRVLTWRVVALDKSGRKLSESPSRRLRF